MSADAYSIDEVAARVGVSRDTIEREIASGQLKARKIGRVYRIPERWYQEWLHRDKEPPVQVQSARSQRAAGPVKAHSIPLPQASGIEQLRAQLRQERQSAKTSTDGTKTKP